ncbi:UNVERIFIED_CONTAM: hypothetical protein K2H54_002404 [Gekko kuhli]
MLEAAMVEDAGTIPSITEALVVLSVLCLVFCIIVSSWEKIPQGLKKLPGPRGYPLICNILQLGKKPHVKLTQMCQKYGDVMKIHIGTRPVVVISGLDTIKQALVKQGEDFMGHPDLYRFRHIASAKDGNPELLRKRRRVQTTDPPKTADRSSPFICDAQDSWALISKATMLFLASLGLASAAEFLLAIVVFCLIFTTLRSSWNQIPQGRREPPGPVGYPLIGSILEIGKNPHLSLTQMSKKYGDVMKVCIGTRPVLVLSGLETIKQAMVKQGGDFMGRPDLYSLRYITDGQSMIFGTDSGEVWAARRKLAHNALRNFASSPSPGSLSSTLLEEHVSREAEHLVAKLQEVMREQQRFDPFQYLVVSVANVISTICFSKRYSYDDPGLLGILGANEEFVAVGSSGNFVDFIPPLRLLPGKSMKKYKEFDRQFTDFLKTIVKDHYERFSKDNIRDITDSLIDLSQEKERKTKIHLPTEQIVYLVSDIFGAGFDTVSTALSWCLAYLVVYPEIQKKIQEEIDETIGSERKPRLSDRPLLPYMEAFIQEVFRHSSFVPFTIPHCTTRDTVLNGYFIPKDMCVFVNQWQGNHDEDLWNDPSAFNPERFLTANGKEVNRDECEKVLIFGLGKRRCVGEVIARWEVFLFLTTLLQELQFLVQDGVRVDMAPRYGLVMKLAKCEHYQVTKRSSKTAAE